ncbi:MAG: YadA-like family protein [Erythrobacter sp.]|nr:YadA-like family protein [Erythrobacter sp.]
MTEVIGAVNEPIVNQLETTVNDITTITLILAPLATITDLDIDLSSILADAAEGDPISLQILDTEGNVITASDDCNITADNLTLDEEGGIEIGGNRVSGLGANGQVASAGEVDAIAFGNNASTAVGATGAVAIGTDASVTAANSVALGAGSVADRADTVSVGAVGAERQIVNVADGTAATDAATVGQVDASIAAATADAVQYDDASHGSVTLDGASGTLVTNVAEGAVSAGSSDAVNGSQLFATNEAVGANADDIATLDGRVTVNEGDIAAIDGRVTVNEGDIAALQDTAVQYDDATQASVTLGGAGGTTITNVAPGALDATSTDAVNGSQLFATNQAVSALDGRVTQNEADIADNSSAIADLQTDVGDIQVTVGEFDGRITQNENDIADLDGRVTVNEGDIADLDGRITVNEGDIIDLDGRVTTNEGDIAAIDDRVTVNEGDIVNLDTRVETNTTNISNIQVQLANVPVTYVSDADGTTPSDVPTHTAAFVGASGGITVTNVAAGTLSADSTEAVNGSQLFETNQNVAQNAADIETINNNLSGSTVVAVQYSDPDDPTVSNGGTVTNDVTLVGADASAPVRLHNVANGMAATDAVNLGQLQSGLNNVIEQTMGYTDQRFAEAIEYTDLRVAEIGFDLAELREDAFSGTAAAMAMSSIPQAIEADRSMVGGGIGHYRGETAFGFGYSRAFNDGRGVVKVSGTLDTHGKGGVAAGAGFSF